MDSKEMSVADFSMMLTLVVLNYSDDEIVNYNAWSKPYEREAIRSNLMFAMECYRKELKEKLLDEFDIDLNTPLNDSILSQ